MPEKVKAFKAAFPQTIPVLTGFAFLGAAYGLLMNSKGYGIEWSVPISLLAFAGSAQYVAIGLLTTVFDPLYALLLASMINARHLFYGISMLEKYKNTGKFKYYLIFGLCDETFSIIHSTKAPSGVDNNLFMFFITILNHSYWVIGTFIGGLLGYLVSFNTKGLDFVLTSLFIAIFIKQWKSKENQKASLIGIFSSMTCLLIFGPSNFIIPSMILIILTLTLLQKQLTKDEQESC